MKRLLSLFSAESVEVLGLWLIVVGLVLEAALIADALIMELLPTKFDKPLSIAFTLMIAVGVWIEHAAASKSKVARDAEAELKFARLDKRITPRVISDDQARAIIEKIKQFSAMPFAVESDPAAEYGFVNRVIEVLQQGSWKWHSYSASLTSLPLGDIGRPNADGGSGVQIRFNKSRFNDFMEPAQALMFALKQALQSSVSIVADPEDSSLACSSDAIHIEIRRKL
jgi:hypothetical protein